MTITERDLDQGTAYGLRPPATRTELTSVRRGTPMGEPLRRYWTQLASRATQPTSPGKFGSSART